MDFEKRKSGNEYPSGSGIKRSCNRDNCDENNHSCDHNDNDNLESWENMIELNVQKYFGAFNAAINKKVQNSACGSTAEGRKMKSADATQTPKDVQSSKQINDEILFIVGKYKKQFVVKRNNFFGCVEFKRMLNTCWKEKNVVEIPDIQPDAFDFMLKFESSEDFLYMNIYEATDICYLASVYKLTSLREAVIQYLYPNTVDKMWAALDCGILHRIQVLKESALKIVRLHTHDVLTNTQFTTIGRNSLIYLLSDDHLDVGSELEVFNAAVCWAESQCEDKGITLNQENLRMQLAEAIHCIRFLTLTAEEIQTSCTSLLTSEETSKIVNVLKREEDASTISSFSSCSRRKRIKETVETPNIQFPLYCSQYFQKIIDNLKMVDTKITTIKVSKPIVLVSVFIHGIQNDRKIEQFYFEHVTAVIYKKSVVFNTSVSTEQFEEIGFGRYQGYVKYNDYFKIQMEPLSFLPLVLRPGSGTTLHSYTIELIFEKERNEQNPPYVHNMSYPGLIEIDGGYVVGFEYSENSNY